MADTERRDDEVRALGRQFTATLQKSPAKGGHTWRCIHTDYRRPQRTYATAFRTVRALHFFKLRFA